MVPLRRATGCPSVEPQVFANVAVQGLRPPFVQDRIDVRALTSAELFDGRKTSAETRRRNPVGGGPKSVRFCSAQNLPLGLHVPEWRRPQVVERLLRFRPAVRRPAAVLANQLVQLLLDVVELEPVFFDAIVLDPRHQEQQQERLLRAAHRRPAHAPSSTGSAPAVRSVLEDRRRSLRRSSSVKVVQHRSYARAVASDINPKRRARTSTWVVSSLTLRVGVLSAVARILGVAEETRLLVALVVVHVLEYVNQGPVGLALLLRLDGLRVPLLYLGDPLGLLKIRKRLALVPGKLGPRSRIGLLVPFASSKSSNGAP